MIITLTPRFSRHLLHILDTLNCVFSSSAVAEKPMWLPLLMPTMKHQVKCSFVPLDEIQKAITFHETDKSKETGKNTVLGSASLCDPAHRPPPTPYLGGLLDNPEMVVRAGRMIFKNDLLGQFETDFYKTTGFC